MNSKPYASWDAAARHSQPWVDATHLGEVIRRDKGAVLYEIDDLHPYFYLIRTGFVQTRIARPDGTFLLVEIYGPGTVFGEGPAFDEQPRFVSAITTTPVVLSRYSPESLDRAFAERPDLSVALIRILSAKQRALSGRLSSVTGSRPEDLLLDLLQRIAEVEARQEVCRTRRLANVTHEQLAAMTGLSRVTVTRALKSLSSRGKVTTRERQVELIEAGAATGPKPV